MAGREVYFNGMFVPESEARVSVFDSALMFGDMAFEMTRTFNQEPFRLRAHLERLYASLNMLEIDCGLSLEQMEKATLDVLQRNLPTEPDDVDWQIMHDVSRGPLSMYRSVFAGRIEPTVVICCWPLYAHMASFLPLYDDGVHMVIVPQPALPAHMMDPKAKTRSRLHYQMAILQAQRIGDHCWPVLLDPDGYLAEGPGWNIFLVRDGVIYSPEPRNILLGVTRAATIELAGELNIPVREVNLGRYEALQADEIFATSTVFCIAHASTFEGRPIGDGATGPVFRRLLDAWKRLTGVDFTQQSHDYASRLAAWEQKEREQSGQLASVS